MQEYQSPFPEPLQVHGKPYRGFFITDCTVLDPLSIVSPCLSSKIARINSVNKFGESGCKFTLTIEIYF